MKIKELKANLQTINEALKLYKKGLFARLFS